MSEHIPIGRQRQANKDLLINAVLRRAFLFATAKKMLDSYETWGLQNVLVDEEGWHAFLMQLVYIMKGYSTKQAEGG